MNRAVSEKEDVLGLVAFGSLIGNLFQAGANDTLKKEREDLRFMYRRLIAHYGMACREYSALRLLNQSLGQQLLALREENNKLLKQVSAKGA